MRALVIFAAGAAAGLGIQLAVGQIRNEGVVGVNHVGISVADMDGALSYYTEVLGFPVAFRVDDEGGRPRLVYLQVSRDTFVELNPATPERPPGINHVGVHVEDIAATAVSFRNRGAEVTEPALSTLTGAILANVTALNGVRIELLELPPDSLHRQASGRFR